MSQLPTLLRAPTADDKNIIFSSWLKSYRSSDFARAQCNTVYYDNYKLIVEQILQRSNVMIACNPENDSQVYGYIVYEPLPGDNLLVHYIYTKFTYRKFGVAKQLLGFARKNTNPILCTHFTHAIESLSKKIPIIYDPYQLLRRESM